MGRGRILVLTCLAVVGLILSSGALVPPAAAQPSQVLCFEWVIAALVTGTGGPTGTYLGTVMLSANPLLLPVGTAVTEVFTLNPGGTFSATLTITVNALNTLIVSKSGTWVSSTTLNNFLLTGTWTVVSGTGTFAGAIGGGSLIGNISPDIVGQRFSCGACVESVNPHGQTVPPAGSTTLPGRKGGINEDGFYTVLGVAGASTYFVNGVFGPFPTGSTVKITEAPGTPSPGTIKLMGSNNGGSGNNGQANAVIAHITLPSDPVFTLVFPSGTISCLVPPPPK